MVPEIGSSVNALLVIGSIRLFGLGLRGESTKKFLKLSVNDLKRIRSGFGAV
jgi:hypothetical protein